MRRHVTMMTIAEAETRGFQPLTPSLGSTDHAVFSAWPGFGQFKREMAEVDVTLTFVADDDGHHLELVYEENSDYPVRIPWPLTAAEQMVVIEYTKALAAAPTRRDREVKAMWPNFGAFAHEMKRDRINLSFDRETPAYGVRIVLLRRNDEPQIISMPWPTTSREIMITEAYISAISDLRQGKRVRS